MLFAKYHSGWINACCSKFFYGSPVGAILFLNPFWSPFACFPIPNLSNSAYPFKKPLPLNGVTNLSVQRHLYV
jgi:hypothetical protein